MAWTFREDDGPAIYDGHRLYITPLMNGSDVIHELAHWCVATSRLRTIENYGCGRDSQARGRRDAQEAFTDGDEVDAAALDIMIHFGLRLDWQQKSKDYNFTQRKSWVAFVNDPDNLDAFQAVSRLTRLPTLSIACQQLRVA